MLGLDGIEQGAPADGDGSFAIGGVGRSGGHPSSLAAGGVEGRAVQTKANVRASGGMLV